MLFTFYALLLWLVEPRVKVQVKLLRPFYASFTSAAHGLFTIEIGSCLVKLDFPVTCGQGGQMSRFSAAPGHGSTYTNVPSLWSEHK